MDLSNQVLNTFARMHGREYVPYCTSPINVLSGEYHGDKYDVNPQAEFIAEFRPKIVLHEFMGIRIYDPTTRQITQRRKESKKTIPISDDRREEINKYFMEKADQLGFLLVGCDLTPAEREYLIQERGGRHQSESAIRRVRKQMGLPVNGLLGVTYLDLADPERHQEMAKVYQQYKRKTDGLLMITGLHHVRSQQLPDWEASDLHYLLKPADYGVIENRQNVRKLDLVSA